MKKKKYSFGKLKKYLSSEYHFCFDYLLENKNYIYLVIGLFFFTSLIGLIFPISALNEILISYFKELLLETEGFGVFEMTSYLFWNNILASFFGMIFGAIFGLFPLIVTILNGYVLGFAANLSMSENGFLFLFRLLPHGIFELPALFISLGMGIKIGTFVFQEDKKEAFRINILNALKIFLYIVFPLLVVAAIIESILIIFS